MRRDKRKINRFMKEITLVLVCVMLVGALVGCSREVDASAYLKALLDNSYKNNSAELIELKAATEKTAVQMREQSIEEELKSVATAFNISTEQAAGLRDNMTDIMFRAKYNVAEAVEQADGSFIVTVTYEQFNVFVPALDAYQNRSNTLTASWTAMDSIATEAEMSNDMMGTLGHVLDVTVLSAKYDAPQTMDVRIEYVDGTYVPNEEDLSKLKYALFDNEEAGK